MTYVITDACVDLMDRSCVRECPVDCIYEGERQLFINPNECVDCGACESACPHDAIFHEADLPDEQVSATERQEKVFVDLGRLGGARKFGKLPLVNGAGE
ncbi:ferredoxin [Rhodococcus sp. NPDC056743]|uniref:ferredoxin n=1 Tax=Rhodococcus sp. NPDC056743 TaxID=3345934 RepID=UPI00366FABD1